MKFNKNNTIPYGQDFRFFKGIPADIEFKVLKFSELMLKLIAPGYGGKPYGNGALYISKKDLEEYKIYEY